MNTDKPMLSSYQINVLSRVIAAAFGGYALVNLSNLALSYVLPVPQNQGLLFAMMISFFFYTGAIIWVFAVRTATKAWLGLLAVALPLLVIDVLFYFRGV